MLDFDTSLIAPMIRSEATSVAVARFVAGLEDELAVSHWTGVEFFSLLARETRMGGTDATTAAAAGLRFEALVRRGFSVMLPTEADYLLARRFLLHPGAGLRGGDALHLAIAANRGAAVIYSLDHAMLRAAAILGVPASLSIVV